MPKYIFTVTGRDSRGGDFTAGGRIQASDKETARASLRMTYERNGDTVTNVQVYGGK